MLNQMACIWCDIGNVLTAIVFAIPVLLIFLANKIYSFFNKANKNGKLYTGLRYADNKKIYIGDKARGWFIGSFPKGKHSNEGVIKAKDGKYYLHGCHGYIELSDYTEGIQKL